MILVADRADASAAGAGVAATATASGATAGSAAAASSQFNFLAIICPILLFLRAVFGPFFAGIFTALLNAFGCAIPSG